ncbi:MAG: hypothetical protein KY476_08645 [Planctomycetes bacterium]|nr:hypothetical protein [Planctomycetota bacterium]
MTLHSWLAALRHSFRTSHRRGGTSRRRAPARCSPAADVLEDRILLSAGALDTSFGGDGLVTTDLGGYTADRAADMVVVQGDGKIVVVGTTKENFGSSNVLTRYNADGSLDQSFGDGGSASVDFTFGEARAVALEADGDVLVAGHSFRGAGGTDFAVARFHGADGSLDTSFGEGGYAFVDFGSPIDVASSIAVDGQGNIVVGGTESRSGFALARLNGGDGSLDPGFGTGGKVVTTSLSSIGQLRDIAIDGNGNIVAAGHSSQGATSIDFTVARYLATDGSLDTSFDGDGIAITHLGAADFALSVAIDSGNNVVLAGRASGIDHLLALVRYRASDGGLDASFGTGGIVLSDVDLQMNFGRNVAIDIDASDNIVAATTSFDPNNPARSHDFLLARYLASDGSLDGSFGNAGLVTTDFANSRDTAAAVSVQGDGRIVVAGNSQTGARLDDFAVARYESSGTLDASFDGDGRVTTDFGGHADDRVIGTALQSDGKALVLGFVFDAVDAGFSSTSGRDTVLTRYNADGSADGTFGTAGRVNVSFVGAACRFAQAVAVDAQDRILVAGHALTSTDRGDFALTRYLSDGRLDETFGNGGSVITAVSIHEDQLTGMTLDADGNILLVGSSFRSFAAGFDVAVVRYLGTNGSLDASFDSDGIVVTDLGSFNDIAAGVAVTQGKVVVAARTLRSGTGNDVALVRYLESDGSPDATFGTGGIAITDLGTFNDSPEDLAVDANGNILVVGNHRHPGFPVRLDVVLARFRAADGALDTAFSGDGIVLADFGSNNNESATNVAVDAGGKVLVAGSTQLPAGVDIALARFLGDGSPDATFGNGGIVTTDLKGHDFAADMEILGDGGILVAGSSQQCVNQDDFALVRYLGTDGSLDTTFGNGGTVTTDTPGHAVERTQNAIVQSDGRIVVLGIVQDSAGFGFGLSSLLLRYNLDGSLDTSFGDGGHVLFNFSSATFGNFNFTGLAMDADENLLVAGSVHRGTTGVDFAVARFRGTDGGLDTTFGTDGYAYADLDDHVSFRGMAVDPAGNIVLAGSAFRSGTGNDVALARLTSAGILDTSFGTGGVALTDLGSDDEDVSAVAVDAGGNVVIAGYSYRGDATGYDYAVARYRASDGVLDPTFDGDGIAITDLGFFDEGAQTVAVDADGNVLAAGWVDRGTSGFNYDFSVVRYRGSDGGLDTTFSGDGIAFAEFGHNDEYAIDIAADIQGNVLVLGATTQPGTFLDFALVRFKGSDGSLDAGFGNAGAVFTDFGGTVDVPIALALYENTIVVAGSSFQGASLQDIAVARYLSVTNAAPVAEAGGPYTVAEGGTVTLDASASTDPDQAGSTLTYAWDLDGDGLFGETGTNAGRGEETGATPTFSAASLDGPNSVTVSLRVTDNGALTSTDTATITVANVAPTASIAGATTGSEGTAVSLTGSVSDPSPVDQAAGFTYAWTVTRSRDGGATFTAYASATTADYLLPPDDDGLYRVTLTATDKDGATSNAATHDVSIVNIAPTASIAGPSGGVRGQTRTFTLGAADPSAVDQAAGFSFQIDWEGDGTVDQTVSGPSGLQLDHVYGEIGTYTMRVTATDKDGGESAAATHMIDVTVVALQDDDCHLGQTALAVGGTLGDDQIHFSPGENAGEIQVLLNGASLGIFTPSGRLLAYGQAGNDNLQVAGSIGHSAWLYGGDGNDRAKGGAGHDVLLGEAGDDLLVGGSGHDLLIGGTGADRIVGNADDDILIAGDLHFADLDEAMCAIMHEWTSARDHATRIANLSGQGTGERANGNVFLIAVDDPATSEDDRTVVDDDAKDVLTGSAGDDWFFFNPDRDRVTDLKDEVFANDLEFILMN